MSCSLVALITAWSGAQSLALVVLAVVVVFAGAVAVPVVVSLVVVVSFVVVVVVAAEVRTGKGSRPVPALTPGNPFE